MELSAFFECMYALVNTLLATDPETTFVSCLVHSVTATRGPLHTNTVKAKHVNVPRELGMTDSAPGNFFTSLKVAAENNGIIHYI